MRKPVVFMFSGQGSQYFQMGRELYETHPRFKLWMDHCDIYVKSATGHSLIETLYGDFDKSHAFDDIVLTNPALVSIEFCLAQLLTEAKIQPDYLLGYSLGEFTAAVVAGVLTLEEGIELCVEVAKALKKYSPAGGMLAIISKEDIVQQHPQAFERCQVSGRNFENNFVVSGLEKDVSELQKYLSEKGVLTQRLAVKFAFHSDIMEPLKSTFKAITELFNYSAPRISIYSCTAGSKITALHEHHLWKVLREPVNFADTIKQVLNEGDFTFIDVGPSGTLSTSVKYCLPTDSGSNFMETMNQFGKDASVLEKTLTKLSDTRLEFA
ncbi:acyltransferase domain-containing protein [Teredinibacter haidensis]|uniref:acyltransferase domain-containing protein n=1 Tax=Teredinibacter haidensis TaxID=2731755 RepID=UPI000948FAA7|nr:acyltransferase domain-containing protein [Teredinibacter haidensis]